MPCLQYIDDRLIGEWLGKAGDNLDVRRENALKSLYVVCEILTRVGYFINIDKSKFVPSTVIRFLGILVDSDRMSFLVPEDKIERFLVLKDEILSYLRNQKVKFCTMVVPCDDVKPVWWPVLCNSMVDHFIIGKKGELNVLLLPSKKGFVCNKVGLKYDLWAARLSFD